MKKKKFFSIVIITIVTIFSTILIIFFSLFNIVTIEGMSMLPTYNNGQIVLSEKNPKVVGFKDVVIFKKHNKIFIKRIIGIQGDIIKFYEGKIFRNGKNISDIFQIENFKSENLEFLVEKDKYFLVGDNLNNSIDSRILGTISFDQIFGKII